MPSKSDTQPRTLVFLGIRLDTTMQNLLWQGAVHAAQAHGVRLLYFPAGWSDTTVPYNDNFHILYDLIDTRYVDGLLMWYAGIMADALENEYEHVLDRYADLPLVTIGGQFRDNPDLAIDNYQGVYAAVRHLVEVHHRQHIAFVRGPEGHPDADERYRGYLEAMQDCQVHVDPHLQAATTFNYFASADATQAAIAAWLADSHQPLDAIITSSDNMARAAVKAIEAGGRRVPEDISVVGFDDMNYAQSSIPSLTTVRQPFYQMGYQATEMLLALVNGQPLPGQTLLQAPFIIRESCGCMPEALALAGIPAAQDVQPGQMSSSEQLVSDLGRIARIGEFPVTQVNRLAQYLQGDITEESSRQFLAGLKLLLVDATQSHFDITAWQNAISALRKYRLSITHGQPDLMAENLFHQARVLVTEMYQRDSIDEQLNVRQNIKELYNVSEALITSSGKQQLIDIVCTRVPQLGIPGFYLSLYEDPQHPETWSTLILAYRDNHRIELPPEGLRFQTTQIVPDAVLPASQSAVLVVEPLYFGEQQWGSLVLEAGPSQGIIYENLRAGISSVLQSSHLLAQVQTYATQLEHRVASRTDELTQAVNQLQQEIAERQRAQEELARERNLLRTLVDSMPDIIFAKDIEGRFTLKNETDMRTMGASSLDEVIGKTDYDFYPHEIAERFTADDKQVIQSGAPLINREELTVDADGNTRWMLTTKVPLRDEQGNIIGLVGMGRDITDRKQVEEAQRQSEAYAREFQQKLKALQEISLELVAAETSEQMCAKAIELGCSKLGYERLGLLLFDDEARTSTSRFGIESDGRLRVESGMVYPARNDGLMLGDVLSDRDTVFVDENAVLGDFEQPVGRGWNVVTGIWDGDASIGWLAADNYFEHRPLIPYQVELLNLYGLTIGHLVTRKRAEAEIRRLNDELEQRVMERTTQLKASNQELESFAYVVSHDLKAPLRAISQLASWLGADYANAFDDDGRQMLDLLTNRTHRMHDLIDGILQYSRIGRVREEKRTIDLNLLVRVVIDALAPPPHIQVRMESPLPTVFGDQTRLEQVFQNLIGNSVKFMDKAEGLILVSCQETETHWQICVSDNGPGIDPRYHDKVFQIFQTLDSHDKYEGTGIGLTLVKKIVEQWSGRIWIESTVGQGSQFFFTIPRDESDA